MTRLRSIALAIKSRLEEIPELAGSVVLFRRSDIESEFEKRMGKTSGRVAIIRVLDGKNTSSSKSSFYVCTITVALFTVPVLTASDARDADDLMADIEQKLHGWWPATVPHNGAVWLTAESITFPHDDMFDVAVLTLKTPKTPMLATIPDTWVSEAGNWDV